MRLYIPPLTEPVVLCKDKLNTVCLENNALYRNTIYNLINEEETEELIFSKDFKPISLKGNVCFINDYYNFQLSSALTKKIYLFLEKLSLQEFPALTQELTTLCSHFLEQLSKTVDFDFTWNPALSLPDLFKMQAVKPDFQSEDILSSLLNYILIVNKYAKPECFVLLNFHLYFSPKEIEAFYNTVKYYGIYIVVLENNFSFPRQEYENLTIIDKDLCEIVENS